MDALRGQTDPWLLWEELGKDRAVWGELCLELEQAQHGSALCSTRQCLALRRVKTLRGSLCLA